MKKKRFSVEQIASVLQQVQGGVPIGEVSDQASALWRLVYRCPFETDALVRPAEGLADVKAGWSEAALRQQPGELGRRRSVP